MINISIMPYVKKSNRKDSKSKNILTSYRVSDWRSIPYEEVNRLTNIQRLHDVSIRKKQHKENLLNQKAKVI